MGFYFGEIIPIFMREIEGSLLILCNSNSDEETVFHKDRRSMGHRAHEVVLF